MRRIRVTGGMFIRGGIVTCLSRFQGPRSVLIPTSLRLSEALRGVIWRKMMRKLTRNSLRFPTKKNAFPWPWLCRIPQSFVVGAGS